MFCPMPAVLTRKRSFSKLTKEGKMSKKKQVIFSTSRVTIFTKQNFMSFFHTKLHVFPTEIRCTYTTHHCPLVILPRVPSLHTCHSSPRSSAGRVWPGCLKCRCSLVCSGGAALAPRTLAGRWALRYCSNPHHTAGQQNST